jgi:putative hydroxymethylpyrimidine transporter CytX
MGRFLDRESPSWGIDPVPSDRRTLSGFDIGVLWWDLSIGLLVLLTGALLVPALGFPRALLAILIGSAIGCAPLAFVGWVGTREGVPGMVLFRPVLGIRGSWLPSFFNLVQLLGWTAFEFWAMATVANQVSRQWFGFDSYVFWLAVVAIVCTLLALGGPVMVIRKWLERFGVWVVAAVGLLITYRAIAAGDMTTVWRAPGQGGLPFWLAVDLVVAQPVSWLPLVADYNRFALPRSRSVAGTYWGYFAGNVWFYALGALLVLAVGTGVGSGVGAIGEAISKTLGLGIVVLLVLLVGETDEAFANIYSWAVSAQNVVPRARQWTLMVGVAVAGFAMAAVLTMSSFQFFLYLIGSVFVPLFGVFAAHFVLTRGARFDERGLFRVGGRYWYRNGVNWWAVLPWIVGFLVYQWSVPTTLGWWQDAMTTFFHGWLHLPFPLADSRFGASIPGFVAAFACAMLVLRPSVRRSLGVGGP